MNLMNRSAAAALAVVALGTAAQAAVTFTLNQVAVDPTSNLTGFGSAMPATGFTAYLLNAATDNGDNITAVDFGASVGFGLFGSLHQEWFPAASGSPTPSPFLANARAGVDSHFMGDNVLAPVVGGTASEDNTTEGPITDTGTVNYGVGTQLHIVSGIENTLPVRNNIDLAYLVLPTTTGSVRVFGQVATSGPTFDIDVTLGGGGPPPTLAPNFTTFPTDQTLDYTMSASLSVGADDPDDTDVTLSLGGAPAFITLTSTPGDPVAGLININPTGPGDIGSYDVTVTATDGNAEVTSQTFNVTITDIPEPASLGLAAFAGMGLLARRRK